MDTCPRCGATRLPDLEWCGQCFARFDETEAPRAPEDAVVMVTRGVDAATSMSTWMRVAITLATLGGGWVLLVAFLPWTDVGDATLMLGGIILIVYAVFAAILLTRLWTTRASAGEHLVVLDAGKVQEVERRQASLIVRGDEDGDARTEP